MNPSLLTSLLLLFTIGFSSCSENPSENSLRKWQKETDKIKILCTTEMIRDIAVEIGGGEASILTLIDGGLDPHSYELVKGDDEKLSQADLVFSNGLLLEHGSSLKYQLENNLNNHSLGDWILNNYPDRIIFHGTMPDPHIWMDIELWGLIIEPIKLALIEQKPKLSSFFEKRSIKLKKKLAQLHAETKSLLNSIPENARYLVTSHDAFFYFTKAYIAPENEKADGSWITRCQAPEGLAPDGKVGLSDIQNILGHIAKHGVSVIFSEAAVSQDSIRKISVAANEMGIRLRFSTGHLYSDSMGGKGSDVENYMQMVPHNASVIQTNLMRKNDK